MCAPGGAEDGQIRAGGHGGHDGGRGELARARHVERGEGGAPAGLEERPKGRVPDDCGAVAQRNVPPEAWEGEDFADRGRGGGAGAMRSGVRLRGVAGAGRGWWAEWEGEVELVGTHPHCLQTREARARASTDRKPKTTARMASGLRQGGSGAR